MSAGTAKDGALPWPGVLRSGCTTDGVGTPAHVVTYITEIERLEVAVAQDMEQYEDGHHLAVGHEAWAIAATFAGGVQRVFFSSGAIFYVTY